MRLGSATVAIEASGLSKFRSDINKAGKTTKGFEKETTKSMKGASSAIKGLGSVIGITFGSAVAGKFLKDTITEFKNFETSVVDMAKVTTRSLKDIRAEVLNLDSALGSSQDLIKGYYQVISAGVTDPIKSLDLLTIAAQTAKSAHVDQAETIKGLTKVMAGFEGQLKSAGEAADLLFAIEKAGQTSVGELIPVIGGLAKITSEVGATTDDLATSLALISQTAGSTSEAATQYEAVLISLYKPTQNLQELFESLGFATGKAMIQELGFIDTIKTIKEHADNAGTSLGDLVGRKEALIGISALAAGNFEKFNDVLEVTKDRVGSQKDAWDNWEETIQSSLDTTTANISKLRIQLVDTFGTDTKGLIDGFAESIEFITVNLDDFVKAYESIPLGPSGFTVIGKYIDIIVAGIKELPIVWVTAQDILLKGLLKIENISKKVWAAISISFRTTFNEMKKAFADFLNLWGTELGKFKIFKSMSNDMLLMSDEVKAGIKPVENLEKALSSLDEEYEQNKKDLKDYINSLIDAGEEQETFTEYIWKTGKAFEDTRKSIDGYNQSLKESSEFATGSFSFADDVGDLGGTMMEAFSDAREDIEGYEWFANVKEDSEENFQGMADFYNDALMQMVDGTGSFSEMIKGKLLNLGASITSKLLTSVTGSVLQSIPGLGDIASGLGGSGFDLSSISSLSGIAEGIGGLFSGGSAGTSILSGGFSSFGGASGFAGMGSIASLNAGGGIMGAFSSAISSATAGLGQMAAALGPVGIALAAVMVGKSGYDGMMAGKEQSQFVGNQGLRLGLDMYQGAVKGILDTVGLGKLYDNLTFGSYGLTKQVANLKHRIHRSERYSGLLQKMSFGTEDEPFDINEYGGIEDFLESRYSSGINQLQYDKSLYATGKYGDITGENLPEQLKKSGELLNDYKAIVEESGAESIEATLANREFSNSIIELENNTRNLSEAGQATIDMYKQLSENAKILQLKDITESFEGGETSFSSYIALFENLNFGELETATFKFNESLRVLTDDTIPELTGRLSFARDLMREASKEIENMSNESENLAVKISILNSDMELSEKELSFIRNSTSEANVELLNLYYSLGLINTEFELFTQETSAAALSAEWFSEQATKLRDSLSSVNILLEDTEELFEKLNISFDSSNINNIIDGLYDFATVLDNIGFAVGALKGLTESGGGLIESIIAGDWETADTEMINMINDVNTLSSALEALNFIKFASLFGEIGKVLIVVKIAADIVNGFVNLMKDIFGGGEEAPVKTVQEWMDSLNPVTNQDFFGALSSAGQETGMAGLETMITNLNHEKDLLVSFGLQLIKDGVKLPENWQELISESTEKAIDDLKESMAQPFSDFSDALQSDIDIINETVKNLADLKSEFNKMSFEDDDYLNKAQELRSLILERYELERQGLESVKVAFQSVYDSVSGQLNSIMTSSDNPADIFERLGIQLDEVNKLKGLVGSSSGLEQAGYQAQLSTALGSYLTLGQEAYQRPSLEYQQIFDMVTADLRNIQDASMSQISIAEEELIALNVRTVEELVLIQTAVDEIRDAILASTGTGSDYVSQTNTPDADAVPVSQVGNVINININGVTGEDLTSGSDSFIEKIVYEIENGALRPVIQNLQKTA